MSLWTFLRRVFASEPAGPDAIAEIYRRREELRQESQKHVEAVRCQRRQNRLLEDAVEIVKGKQNGHAHH